MREHPEGMLKKTAPPSFEAVSALEPPANIFKSSAELNKTGISFLKIDLDTASTFAEIALRADDTEKRERNRHNARVGYDTVVRLLPRVTPMRMDAEILTEKLDRLRANLLELGERF